MAVPEVKQSVQWGYLNVYAESETPTVNECIETVTAVVCQWLHC